MVLLSAPAFAWAIISRAIAPTRSRSRMSAVGPGSMATAAAGASSSFTIHLLFAILASFWLIPSGRTQPRLLLKRRLMGRHILRAGGLTAQQGFQGLIESGLQRVRHLDRLHDMLKFPWVRGTHKNPLPHAFNRRQRGGIRTPKLRLKRAFIAKHRARRIRPDNIAPFRDRPDM